MHVMQDSTDNYYNQEYICSNSGIRSSASNCTLIISIIESLETVMFNFKMNLVLVYTAQNAFTFHIAFHIKCHAYVTFNVKSLYSFQFYH